MSTAIPILNREALPASSTEASFGVLQTAQGALPLAALEVHARVVALVSETTVRQVYVNAYAEPLEATYIFPLPDRAAVTRFRLRVGGRLVEGELQERGKARANYDRAIRDGHRAAIAEEERPNVFTLRVGNILSGERAEVELSLVSPLSLRDDEVTFQFPLVVAPRYIPGIGLPGPVVGTGTAADTDQVPDASRISPPVLLPGFASPVQLRLRVDVADQPLPGRDFRSSLHTVARSESAGVQSFEVYPGERLDRDFILRYRVGSERIQTGLAVQPDANGEGGTFLLTLLPPMGVPEDQMLPRSIVFVLDRSGSMSGWKIVVARRAVARMIETLTARDRFAVYAFDNTIETPPGSDGLSLVPGTDRQRFLASEYLSRLQERGGTEMAEPLERAVTELQRLPAGGERMVVLITDGQVGNENQILQRIGKNLAGIRILTLGIDRAVNAGFLRQLAQQSGGHCELVESEMRLEEVMQQWHRLLGTPVLRDLEVRGKNFDILADTMTPERLPDLFLGAPVCLYGRYRGSPSGSVAVTGRTQEGKAELIEILAHRADTRALSALWARSRIRDLEDRYVMTNRDPDLQSEIVKVSLEYSVLSRFTAFVAVDRQQVVNPGGKLQQRTQPVELPDGWDGMDALCGQVAPTVSHALHMHLDGGSMQHCNSIPSHLRRMRYEAIRAAEASSASDAELKSAPGLLQKILQVVGLGSSKQTAAPNRQELQARAKSLYERLEQDNSMGEAEFQQWATDFQQWLDDIVQAGYVDACVTDLQKLQEKLLEALTATNTSSSVLDGIRQQLLAGLRTWLNLPEAAAPADRRSGFWK